MSRVRRRVATVVALLVVPWMVLFVRDTRSLYFPVGFHDLGSPAFTTIWDYYFRYSIGPAALPGYLVAYGIGALLLALAVVSALLGVVWREDARITAALLVLAGLSNAWFALGFLRRSGYVAVPVGTVLSWVVVWWYYAEDFRRVVAVTDTERN
ncbi:MAG: TIGR04206 family protein [Halorientalis sp.]